MRKSRILLVVLTIVILTTSVVALTACKKKSPPLNDSMLEVWMDGNFYVGTSNADGTAVTVDLTKAFPGASGFELGSTSAATLSGTTLTVSGTGDFEISCTEEGKKVTKKIHVVDGVNVADEAQFRAQINDGKNVVFQADIATAQTEGMTLKSTIYGNGFELNATSVSHEGKNSVFNMNEGVAVINDLHLYGRKATAEQSFSLDDFEGNGALVTMSGNSEKRPNLTIKHSVFENAMKLIWMDAASDLTIDGTILRNGADAIIAVRTSNVKGSTLNISNTVISNSVVAGILFCGWDEVSDESCYATLNVKGFLDIFNWKGEGTAKIMPSTEQFSGVVNGLISSELGKKDVYADYLVNDGGEDYVHFGIIVISTGGLENNAPTINGLEKDYVQKKIPLPKLAAALNVLKTGQIYGYGKAGYRLKPTEKMSDNANLYADLYYGR